MLVLLRLNIGWHFFSEGVHHCADPLWTSEPVLRAAKGPLAPWYQAYLPDFHGFREWLHGEVDGTESQAVQGWIEEIEGDWKRNQEQFAAHYGLDDKQQKRAAEVARKYQGQLRSWAGERRDELANHVHQWRRTAVADEAPAADVPFQQDRVVQSQRSLAAEADGWLAELRSMEQEFDGALLALLNDQQRTQSPVARRATSIDLVDATMKYVVLTIGVLLLVGLFTRLACVAGAAFLFSVVMMQPFWISETAPTFNQYVEMFALLTLATTQVGRWAGLDYFVHNLIARNLVARNRQTKGNGDVFES
jgi:uncharacterized membrane protein YphA (DoxX/SURF4 family)